MRTKILIAAFILLACCSTALAGMMLMEEGDLDEVQGSMGATISFPISAQATCIAIKDDSPSPSYLPNSELGWLTFGNVWFDDGVGADGGRILVSELTMDIAEVSSTRIAVIGVPVLVGRVAIESIRIGSGGTAGSAPSTWNNPMLGRHVGSIEVYNLSTQPGSALMMWAD